MSHLAHNASSAVASRFRHEPREHDLRLVVDARDSPPETRSGFKKRHTLEGLLQVYHESQWGTVCDDRWTFLDAEVACKQLGFSGADAARLADSTHLLDDAWSSTVPIWMDNVKCSGSEAKLASCAFRGWRESNCNHFEDVVLRCKGSELETTVGLAKTFLIVSTVLSLAALASAILVLVRVQRQLQRCLLYTSPSPRDS